LEAAVIEYLSLFGNDKMIDTTVITEIADFFEFELGYKIPANYPFMGKDFNTTRAGIHADGVIKNKEIYTIFNTEKLLNRTIDVSITDKTGVASVAHWINTNILRGRKFEKINKRHPGIKRIYDWILDEYEKGRNTIISNEEMHDLVKLHLPELVESDFDKLIKRTKNLAFELLEEITSSEELRSMSPSKVEPVLMSYEEMYHFIQFIYVVNTNGEKITINITQPEDRDKYGKYITRDMNFSNRDWFINPLKNGEMFASDFFTSKITGELTMTVSAPIVDDNHDIKGIVGLDLRFQEIAALDGNALKLKPLETDSDSDESISSSDDEDDGSTKGESIVSEW
jgi:citrate (Re)-synthase